MGYKHSSKMKAKKRRLVTILFEKMAKADFSDNDLAELLDLKPLTITHWRSGRPPAMNSADLKAVIGLVEAEIVRRGGNADPTPAPVPAPKAERVDVSQTVALVENILSVATDEQLIAELKRRMGH